LGEVINVDNFVSLEDFFIELYGDQQGWAYSPTLDPSTNDFEQYFFQWPQQKDQLISHVQRLTKLLDVYYGVGLFRTPGSAEKDNFLGTNFVWVEFDGQLPEPSLLGRLAPGIKLRSSTTGHEHWYWRLDHFESDISTIEDISQRLTYYLGGDLGCWNANRVLRPPGTTHHDSGLSTSIVRWAPTPHQTSDFKGLPVLPIKLLTEEDFKYIPDALDVVLKYPFKKEDADFFKCREQDLFKDPDKGKADRSGALTKLGHIGVEMGMSNVEILALLWNADDRWHKYDKRRDRKRWYVGIINYCRTKHIAKEEEVTHLKVYTYGEFAKSEIHIDWVIPGLIHKQGRCLISGQPGTGKSQISFRLAEKLSRGDPFLKWSPENPMRIMFVSMEMPHGELKYITDQMLIDPENPLTSGNLLIMPVGYSIQITKLTNQAEFANVVERYQPDGIVFDSLGVGIGGGLEDDKLIMDTFHYVKSVLSDRFGVFTWFIHHDRKPQPGNKKPSRLEDLFGSQYIGAEITTGLGLWDPNKTGIIEVNCLKLRMASAFPTFKIKRTSSLDYVIPEPLQSLPADKPVFSGLMDSI
jgi:AAA domain